jgi:hypothetical protein
MRTGEKSRSQFTADPTVTGNPHDPVEMKGDYVAHGAVRLHYGNDSLGINFATSEPRN